MVKPNHYPMVIKRGNGKKNLSNDFPIKTSLYKEDFPFPLLITKGYQIYGKIFQHLPAAHQNIEDLFIQLILFSHFIRWAHHTV
jgi:hypothetical protein